jgi:di/tricarboxylate transporter
MNGLEYADDVFNKLSKGSSYFIPKVAKGSDKLVGTYFSVTIKLESGEQGDRAALMLATGIVPPAIAGLAACFALILTGVMSVEQSYRAIDWTTVILVAAMMPLSTAMEQTGAAQMMAEYLVAMVGDSGPHMLLAGLFILTAVLGQLISNTATALIVIPIGAAAAAAIGVSPMPVLMCVGVAAAGAFLTPIATPTNLMVMGPGGYAFSDYWKLGLPLMIWFFIVAVFLVPLLWSL